MPTEPEPRSKILRRVREGLTIVAEPQVDREVIGRLCDLHAKVEPIIGDLEATLARFHSYRPRLDAALDKLKSGGKDWFTKPLIDSYHTVWFQLHEDLLNTLGIERSQEGSH